MRQEESITQRWIDAVHIKAPFSIISYLHYSVHRDVSLFTIALSIMFFKSQYSQLKSIFMCLQPMSFCLVCLRSAILPWLIFAVHPPIHLLLPWVFSFCHRGHWETQRQREGEEGWRGRHSAAVQPEGLGVVILKHILTHGNTRFSEVVEVFFPNHSAVRQHQQKQTLWSLLLKHTNTHAAKTDQFQSLPVNIKALRARDKRQSESGFHSALVLFCSAIH